MSSSFPSVPRALHATSTSPVHVTRGCYRRHRGSPEGHALAGVAAHPGRFEFTFTPKSGSWLQLVAAFLANLVRTMPRGMRVMARLDLCQRVVMCLIEVNGNPGVSRWRHRLDALAMAHSAWCPCVKASIH